jgi:exosome complex component RRP46
LTAAVPLKLIATSAVLAIPANGQDGIIVEPSAIQVSQAQSVYAVGFTSDNDLLLLESEGSFSPAELAKVLEAGEQVCCRSSRGAGADADTAMSGLESASVKDFIRSVMESKLAEDLAWRQ